MAVSVRDVLIVGAGPSGLAAAIACRHHGLDYVVLEQGALVDAIARFPLNMVFFTTPELLEVGGVPLTSPYEKPTRAEALRYYRKVTDTFQLQIALFEQVTAVERDGDGDEAVFAVATRTRLGAERVRHARAVVLAMGYYDRPNRLGVPGEDLPHVSHYYSEPHPYYRRRVVVVGGKNSACEAALDLYRNGAKVTLVHRGEALGDSVKYWVRPDMENRIKEGAVAAHFNTRIVEITATGVVVETAGARHEIAADSVLLLTGYRADPDVPARRRRDARSRDADSAARSGHLRDQRPEPVRGRWPAGRCAHGLDLHRERPLPRRAGGKDPGRALQRPLAPAASGWSPRPPRLPAPAIARRRWPPPAPHRRDTARRGFRVLRWQKTRPSRTDSA